MTPKQIAAIKGMLAYFDSGNNIPVDKAVIKANCAEVAALRAALAEPAPVQEPVNIEQIAAERYKVAPAHESMFHRWAVVAGDGSQQLYLGREVDCQNMARKFAGAFLDGAYLAASQSAPVQEPTERKAPCARHCEAQAFKIEQRQLVRLTVDFMEIIAKQRVVMQQAWEVLGSMDVGTTSRTLGARVALREVLDIPVAAQQPALPADVPMLTDDEILNAYCANPSERQYVTVFCAGAKWAEKTLRQKAGLK